LKIKPRLLSYTSNSPLERGGVCFHLPNIKLSPYHISISFKICSSLNLKTAIPIRSSVFLHSILFIDFKIHENNHRLQSQASIRDKSLKYNCQSVLPVKIISIHLLSLLILRKISVLVESFQVAGQILSVLGYREWFFSHGWVVNCLKAHTYPPLKNFLLVAF
jgi:hypothetical protein